MENNGSELAYKPASNHRSGQPERARITSGSDILNVELPHPHLRPHKRYRRLSTERLQFAEAGLTAAALGIDFKIHGQLILYR